MKKIIVILSFGCFIACGTGSNEKASTEEKNEEVKKAEDQAENQTGPSSDYQKGLDLVANSDCFTCHKVSEQGVGPAYQAVAARYANTPEVIDTLANKIISGGAGRWGSVPMSPHPQLSKEDATAMVKYVLSLKQQ